MDTGLLHKGLVSIERGKVLRLRDAAGRHIGVMSGSVWITQDNDLRDRVLADGGSFRFDRNGLALVMSLGGTACVLLEDGLGAETGVIPGAQPVFSHEALEYHVRRARRLRAQTFATAFAILAGTLKTAWAYLSERFSAAMQAGRAARELRTLDDHTLRDIGLRRDLLEGVGRKRG